MQATFLLHLSTATELPDTSLLPELAPQSSNMETKPFYNLNAPALPGHGALCNPNLISL